MLSLKCERLTLQFPSSGEELLQQCAEFKSLSLHGALQGCVGAIWVVITPSRPDTEHIASFFSGHYHCYGVNVQATSDQMCLCPLSAPGVQMMSELFKCLP